jgi:hypothetical protein
MKPYLLAGALALALTTTAAAQPRPAASAGLPYTQGPVWTYTHVDVKPGQFDAYISYLSGNWRRAQEAAKRSGDLLDYKVLVVDSPRAGEPDLVLAYQWKNMAVFDRSPDDIQAQSLGAMNLTPQQATQGSIDREAMRSNMGEITMRELRFK